jgi:dienelactone hydrolase
MSRRQRRWLRAAIVLGVVLVLIAVGLLINTLGRWQGATVATMAPAALADLLRPHYRTRMPDGPGPFPTAILLSGCDGPHDNLDRWAERLAAEGWASVVVDSHTPRGFGEYEIWRLVCAGQLLMGSERAGDLLVALEDVRAMPFVDPSRIALVGSSHGGWTIMDLLAIDPPERLPFNLSALPGDPATDPLRGVVAAVLLYPWCGFGNHARGVGWDHPAPVLFVLAGRDTIAPADYCDSITDALEERGADVETLVLPEADHAFDQVDHGPATWLRFDGEATAVALDAAMAFLSRAAGPQAPPDPPPPGG